MLPRLWPFCPAMGPTEEAPAGDCLRVFFALWPPLVVAQALHGRATTLRAQVGGRVMALETLHLTLAFLGDVPRHRLADLLKIGANFGHSSGFSLNLDQLGYWPHNHILWAAPGRQPPALGRLVTALAQALREDGFGIEKRAFRPHLTLLRHAHPKAALPALAVPAWPVDELVLVASSLMTSGPRYQLLGRWPLAPEAGGGF